MLFLARFILRGPAQAAGVAAIAAVLGAIPIIGWFSGLVSGAAVALVTLVQSQRSSFRVLLFAFTGAALLAGLLFSMPWLAVYFALMVWLPVWMAATVLRRTLSLVFSIQMLSLLSLLVIIVLSVYAEALAPLWQQVFDRLFQNVVDQSQGQLSVEQLEQAKQHIVRMMPGLLATSLLIGTLVSLLLARWWQAMQYHPGGFGEEYRSLDLGKVTALAALLIIMLAVMVRTDMWLAMLAVVMTVYLVQATAVLHAIFNRRKLNPVGLYLIYAASILFIPYSLIPLMLLGLTDTWFDFRRRLAAS